MFKKLALLLAALLILAISATPALANDKDRHGDKWWNDRDDHDGCWSWCGRDDDDWDFDDVEVVFVPVSSWFFGDDIDDIDDFDDLDDWDDWDDCDFDWDGPVTPLDCFD